MAVYKTKRVLARPWISHHLGLGLPDSTMVRNNCWSSHPVSGGLLQQPTWSKTPVSRILPVKITIEILFFDNAVEVKDVLKNVSFPLQSNFLATWSTHGRSEALVLQPQIPSLASMMRPLLLHDSSKTKQQPDQHRAAALLPSFFLFS